LLGADVVGFQTPADVEAFLACCTDLLGAVTDPIRSTVVAGERRVRVRAYPASVDPVALQRLMQSKAVGVARERLEPRLTSLNIIRVDRLDPSKNQLIGFRAFGRLLEQRPDLHGRVRFLAYLIPSRTDLAIYRAYRDAVYECIEEINARFAETCGHPPIEVFYTNNREQALAAMEVCDVLLVNSLKDGMNLVAKEWSVVSRRPGVLVLSETVGVVEEAYESALIVSPLDVEGTARAMADALDMPNQERTVRLDRFRARVMRWTARNWLSAQLGDLGIPAAFSGSQPGR
jgi:trehalose 6-phosphate synthase